MIEYEQNIRSKQTENKIARNIVLIKVANVTELDLSNGKISFNYENLDLPPNLVHLNLSNNKLTEVPPKVLELHNLKTLNLSFNSIMCFDDTPSFCHTVEQLNLSNNLLEGPPFWVWAEKPNKLAYLNLSNNINMCKILNNTDYFNELLQYKTPVNLIDIHNCKLEKYKKLMATFKHAKVVILGSDVFHHSKLNYLEQIPCAGLDECCEIESMNLSNTQLFQINPNIDIYQNIKEINFAHNSINRLPVEFCNLKSLEICILSFNKLLYLPDSMCKLTNLVRLYLNDNDLCTLPDNFHEMTSLKILDLYNNYLNEGLVKIDNLEELDYAQNYFEEPDDEEYLLKKAKLRVNGPIRKDGRKVDVAQEDSEYGMDKTDDSEIFDHVDVKIPDASDTRCSSPENWDSDDYWVPFTRPTLPSGCRALAVNTLSRNPRAPWLEFVQKKMEEGNFCPMDTHPMSIADQVMYEKLCNPPVEYESDGQFDDCSDDEG